MKLYIIPNTSAERYIAKLRDVLDVLNASYECSMSSGDSQTIYGDRNADRFPIEEADLIVSLGGDGTFLRACQKAIEADKPISGINCGRLGYLCRYHPEDDLRFEDLKEERFPVLCVRSQDKEYYAVNDVVIGKDYFGGTVQLRVSVNDAEQDLIGDGLILATPLGSTAYNRSAGGKILSCENAGYTLTPICACYPSFRAEVLEGKDRVRICLLRDYSASVYVDGILIGKLDEIEVSRKENAIRIWR